MTGPSSYSKTYTSAAAGSFATFDTTADALTTNGTYTYTTTATGYSAVAPNTIVSGTILGSLTVTGIPSSDTAGMMYDLTVTAKDTTGAVMTSYTGPVALTSSDAAVIPQNYTFNTSDAGVHTFNVALNTVGTQSVTATALTRAQAPMNWLQCPNCQRLFVADEREIVTNVLYQWNNANAVARELVLQPVKWETHSSPRWALPHNHF